MEPSNSFLDIQQMVREIRGRVQTQLTGSPAAAAAAPAYSSSPGPDLSRLRDSLRRVRRATALVGQAPPQPPGLRARIGAALVRIVQRMLFWYTPQIREFHNASAEAAEEQVAVAAALSREVHACASGIRALELRLATERSSASQRDVEERQALATQVAALSERNTRLEAAVEMLQQEVQRNTRLEAAVEALERERQQDTRLEHTIEDLRATQRELAQARTDLVLQDRRITILLEEAARRLPEPLSQEQARAFAEEERFRFDSLYAAFEDAFRGARSDIKKRLRVYLPMLREAGVGGPEMPALDLGCGRGEWLELLADHGMQARGVDGNRAMIARCEALGLTAFHADVLAYLRSLPAASLGLVTAFHVLEHLPMRQLLDTLDETVRVLKPGGLAIFETPNPDNLLVGANTFYQDLTHIRPLPGGMLKFMAEARGLFRVQILPLHPYPEDYRLAADERGVGQRLNELFYGPQDYAVIGRKL